jgi:hypothetical protein
MAKEKKMLLSLILSLIFTPVNFILSILLSLFGFVM